MKKQNKQLLLKVVSTLIAIPVLLIIFALVAIGPVDTSRSNCKQVEGVVEQISEATSYDIVFKLKDDNAIYYVNRGLERGLELNDLKAQLEGKKVSIWHAKTGYLEGGHITQVEAGEKIIYTEWVGDL